MTKDEQEKAIREAACAAWESTTMQNLSPLLTSDESAALWECILVLRTSGDVAAFTLATRQRLPIQLYAVAEHLTAALTQLARLSPET